MRKRKLVILTGILSLAFMGLVGGPQHGSMEAFTSLGSITSYASEQQVQVTQSPRWQGSGEVWRVSDNSGGFLKNSWFQDDISGHWYLMGAEDGSVMYSGLITDQSTGKTYLPG